LFTQIARPSKADRRRDEIVTAALEVLAAAGLPDLRRSLPERETEQRTPDLVSLPGPQRPAGRGGGPGTDLTNALSAEWHTDGMARTRLSTTVDSDLLARARGIRSDVTDAAIVDEALAALLARHRAAEVDASYAAYDEHPLDEPDDWGDLASFRRAAAAS
jgi:hypothetical protein